MKKNVIAIILALVMSLTFMTGCGQTKTNNEGTELASGGVMVLRVNPEIAINYDENGKVTKVTARNDDAKKIIVDEKVFLGQEMKFAVKDLVTEIGKAGYFVEEIEGENRQITLEIESGSRLPYDTFIDDVVTEVRNCVNNNKWEVPMEVENESEYGISDYVDTDYGKGNDGVTDFDTTDYDATDYDATDYGKATTAKKPATTTAKKPATTTAKKPATTAAKDTDYNDTDYDVTDYDATDYDDSDYGKATTAKKPATTTAKKPATTTAKKPATTTAKKPETTTAAKDTDYDDSNYDESDYNEKESDYDDNSSDYDDSDYDD